jgi:hypothetical protein
MADITFTTTAVKMGTNAQIIYGKSGATITRVLAVYLDGADNEYKIADCTSAASDAVAGIAMNDAADGQEITIQISGNLTADNLVANTIYVLSAAGKLCAAADFNATTDDLTVVGCATSTTNLLMGIIVTGSGITG